MTPRCFFDVVLSSWPPGGFCVCRACVCVSARRAIQWRGAIYINHTLKLILPRQHLQRRHPLPRTPPLNTSPTLLRSSLPLPQYQLALQKSLCLYPRRCCPPQGLVEKRHSELVGSQWQSLLRVFSAKVGEFSFKRPGRTNSPFPPKKRRKKRPGGLPPNENLVAVR